MSCFLELCLTLLLGLQQALIGHSKTLMPDGTDGFLGQTALEFLLSKQKMLLGLMLECELDCGNPGLGGLLKSILLWNVGNLWIVVAAFTFTFLLLRPLEKTFVSVITWFYEQGLENASGSSRAESYFFKLWDGRIEHLNDAGA